jgi:hypothetical protein
MSKRVTDAELRESARVKREAMEKHGYGSPEHRAAQRRHAALLLKADS